MKRADTSSGPAWGQHPDLAPAVRPVRRGCSPADEEGLTHSLEVTIIIFGFGTAIFIVLAFAMSLGWSYTLVKGTFADATRDGAALLQRRGDRDLALNITTAETRIRTHLEAVQTGRAGSELRPIAAFSDVNCHIDELAGAPRTQLLRCSALVTLRPPIDSFFGDAISSPPWEITSSHVLELP